MADTIRSKFQTALGSLDGYPFNPNLRSSFVATGAVLVNGAGGSGVTVQVLLYVVSAFGAPTPGPTLCSGSGSPGANGAYSVEAKGVYDVTVTDYTVEIDVMDQAGIVAQKTIPISGATLYSQGVSWSFSIGTQFTVQGLVTLDRGDGNGPQPAANVTINVGIESVDASGNLLFGLYGSGSSGSDGTYSITVLGFFNASGGAQSAFDKNYTADWGVTNGIPNEVAWNGGAINGATLIAGPDVWNVALTLLSSGQITSTSSVGKHPPPHHGKTP